MASVAVLSCCAETERAGSVLKPVITSAIDAHIEAANLDRGQDGTEPLVPKLRSANGPLMAHEDQ